MDEVAEVVVDTEAEAEEVKRVVMKCDEIGPWGRVVDWEWWIGSGGVRVVDWEWWIGRGRLREVDWEWWIERGRLRVVVYFNERVEK